MPKIDLKTYKFEELKDGITPVRILKGKYKDVVYQYGRVSVSEIPDTDQMKLSYSFDVLDAPTKYDRDELMGDTSFRHYLGDILTHIIMEDVWDG